MLVYHGSTQEIRNPKTDVSRKLIDFGQGFYATTIKDQAEKWAKRKAGEKRVLGEIENAVVNIYEYTQNSHLLVKKFGGYNEEWLMFVVNNRRGLDLGKNFGYDIYEGFVADDDVAVVVDNFMQLLEKGRANDTAIKAALLELEYQIPNNQICFASNKSLQYLKFIESYAVKK